MASEPRFFVLENDFHGPYDTAAEPGDGFETGDAPRCPKCGGAIGMREWLPPYRIEVAVYGKQGAGDFVMCIRSRLLSERMASAFRSEGLTGFEGFHSVEVVKLNARAKRLGIPKYLLVEATFGRAAVYETHSRIRRSEPIECDDCRNTGVDGIYGFQIEPGTWDGLDAFRPRGLQADVVVSERFADFVQRHGFTNIKLIPTEQYVWDPLRKGPPPVTLRQDVTVRFNYEWSDVQVVSRPDVPGSQLVAHLRYTEGGCSADYEVWAQWPAVSCGDEAGNPSDAACTEPGYGLNPEFASVCDPTQLRCVPEKRPPSLRE